MTARVLVVDDDPGVRSAIARALRVDYEVGSPALMNRGALIADLEAIASIKALNVTLIGLTD